LLQLADSLWACNQFLHHISAILCRTRKKTFGDTLPDSLCHQNSDAVATIHSLHTITQISLQLSYWPYMQELCCDFNNYFHIITLKHVIRINSKDCYDWIGMFPYKQSLMMLCWVAGIWFKWISLWTLEQLISTG
jgi:hypothetical protein